MTGYLPPKGITISSLPGSADRLPVPIHPGVSCPNCRQGKLDYTGLPELDCPRCGYIISKAVAVLDKQIYSPRVGNE